MRLRIVEYSAHDILNGNKNYRYILELDERCVLWLHSKEKTETEQVIRLLMKSLEHEIDYNMEHYVTINDNIPGLEKEIIFEQEVSDTFLKELKIKRRIEDLAEDFK